MRNGLENIMKIGYALILVSIGLMIWASSVRAVNIPDPPCIFSSLCSCTQFHPDNFGNVKCVNVEHPMIPRDINMSRVYQLKMDNTGLMEIENNAFQQTGIYRMEIMNNPLYDIPDGAFYGLERSLVDLILKNNRLIEVPTKALRHLTKLKTLDLSGNEIGSIARDSFRGLQDTLEILNLADNSIRFLPIDTFHGVPRLTSIDLSSNNLMEIETDVFREQIDRLERVNLADNLLVEIPFMPLSLLKRLKYLDLSSNRIFDFRMLEIEKERNLLGKLSLDELHLEHNEIQFVKTASFQYFLTANKTFLDFNPIHTISDSAFQSARIRELYIRHCKLDFIDPSAFSGLESSLQILDLSGNNITALPENLLRAFDFLAMLNVKDNRIRTIFPKNAAILSDMQRLDISGENHDPINLQELRRFDRLRTLTVGKLTKDSLMAEDFIGYGTHLENLRIYKAGLRSIKANAFVHLRGLKRLDLSENMIDSIEKGSFRDLGMSLISLKIVHGFSTSFSQFPDIRELEGLKQIDFSNNRLRTLTDQSLYSLKNIEIVNLNDNQIEHLPRGTFQSDIHRRLEEVSIEFNFIKNIITHCFVDLEVRSISVTYIYLLINCVIFTHL
jgi:Leucine-rich repeat (LRR) protein